MTLQRATLPSWAYRDADRFRRELDAIWQREWLFVGHGSEWPGAGDFQVIAVGDQEVIVTRDRAGQLRAFHNTCRHRGAQLCQAHRGRFPAGRLVCPYHGWAYGLDGNLLSTPPAHRPEHFDHGDYPLYPVALQEWRGFVFINLDAGTRLPVADAFGSESETLTAWPLEDLVVVHREDHEVACNWKVFWENFLECYHCPGVHPDLCRLVPLYGEGVTDPADLPDGHPLKSTDDVLRPGAVTWSPDGAALGRAFEGLDEAERRAGMTFTTGMPGVFIVAHLDYVRTVRVLPLAPETTRLSVTWLLSPEAAADDPDIEQLTAFGRQVVLEDARICEINQRGLRSRAHAAGVLMPPEHDVAAFHDWLRERLEVSGSTGTRPRTDA